MENQEKKLFENIERIKRGEKINGVESKDGLLSAAQKITKARAEDIEINLIHKENLKRRLQEQLQAKGSAGSVWQKIFAWQPANLMAYGSLTAVICLVIFLSVSMPSSQQMVFDSAPAAEESAAAEKLAAEKAVEAAAKAPVLETAETEEIIEKAGVGGGGEVFDSPTVMGLQINVIQKAQDVAVMMEQRAAAQEEILKEKKDKAIEELPEEAPEEQIEPAFKADLLKELPEIHTVKAVKDNGLPILSLALLGIAGFGLLLLIIGLIWLITQSKKKY